MGILHAQTKMGAVGLEEALYIIADLPCNSVPSCVRGMKFQKLRIYLVFIDSTDLLQQHLATIHYLSRHTIGFGI